MTAKPPPNFGLRRFPFPAAATNMTSDAAALTFEQSHVHQVYDVIASDFSRTRHTRWPFVERFVEQLPSSSVVLDAGCGNGKYLGVDSCLSCDYQPARPPAALAEAAEATWRKSRLLNVGLDMSRGLLEIAAERGHEVVRADCYDSAACFRPGVVVSAARRCSLLHTLKYFIYRTMQYLSRPSITFRRMRVEWKPSE